MLKILKIMMMIILKTSLKMNLMMISIAKVRKERGNCFSIDDLLDLDDLCSVLELLLSSLPYQHFLVRGDLEEIIN